MNRVDVACRRSRILEFHTSRSDLFQSSGRAIRVADYSQENRDGVGRQNKG